jgi:hypothetical protein
MKSERRRELKANALIWHLQGLPEKIKKYQSQISLVVIVIALAAVLIQYRIRSAQDRLAAAQSAVSLAADDLSQLRNIGDNVRQLEYMLLSGKGDPGLFMKERDELYFDGVQHADDALQKGPDNQPLLKAHALLTKGDLNFEMANFPEMPGAATQPALRPSESKDDLLSAAADAYSQALQSYGDLSGIGVAARFGLAAVAENRGQWDEAQNQYQAITGGDAAQAYKDYAKQRLDILPQLQRSAAMDLGPSTQATTK